MHDAAASFTHEKARKFDKEIKIENKSYKTKHNVINLKQEMQSYFCEIWLSYEWLFYELQW